MKQLTITQGTQYIEDHGICTVLWAECSDCQNFQESIVLNNGHDSGEHERAATYLNKVWTHHRKEIHKES